MQGGIEGGGDDLPEEICPAVEFAVAGETPFGQDAATVDTADALGVPRPVQHCQKKLVQNGAITTGTRHNHRQLKFNGATIRNNIRSEEPAKPAKPLGNHWEPNY